MRSIYLYGGIVYNDKNSLRIYRPAGWTSGPPCTGSAPAYNHGCTPAPHRQPRQPAPKLNDRFPALKLTTCSLALHRGGWHGASAQDFSFSGQGQSERTRDLPLEPCLTSAGNSRKTAQDILRYASFVAKIAYCPSNRTILRPRTIWAHQRSVPWAMPDSQSVTPLSASNLMYCPSNRTIVELHRHTPLSQLIVYEKTRK